MRSVHTWLEPVERVTFRRVSPACLGTHATVAGVVEPDMSFTLSPSCRPWLHGRYPLHSYYGDSDSRAAPFEHRRGSLCLCHDAFGPFSLQPPLHRIQSPDNVGCEGWTGTTGADFAFPTQARLVNRPNRVHPHWYDGLGRVFSLGQLPTPPCGDAVASGFSGGTRCTRTGTFTCCHHAFANARRARGGARARGGRRPEREGDETCG
jgi:hypothetical protein